MSTPLPPSDQISAAPLPQPQPQPQAPHHRSSAPLRHRSNAARPTTTTTSTSTSPPPSPTTTHPSIDHASIQPAKHTPRRPLAVFTTATTRPFVAAGGPLRPFRLLGQDFRTLGTRYLSDWTVWNHKVVASAVYLFFANLLPGISFASDLYTLTGRNWGTIEVILSTGVCGVVFALLVAFFRCCFCAWGVYCMGGVLVVMN